MLDLSFSYEVVMLFCNLPCQNSLEGGRRLTLKDQTTDDVYRDYNPSKKKKTLAYSVYTHSKVPVMGVWCLG